MMDKRAEIIIHGRVQKAGFRDFIDEIAFDLNLNGYVQNLVDGTVQVVCEGREDLISELLDRVNIVQYPIRVENIEVTYKEPAGEYKTFEVIRDDDLVAATYERMDAAVRYMREMNSNLGNKIDQNSVEIREMNSNLGNKIDQNSVEIREMNSNLGNKIDQNSVEIREMNSNLGNKIDQNSVEIREMNSNLGNKIDNVSNKIDKLGDTLDQNRAEVRGMNSNLGQKMDVVSSNINQSRAEIVSEIRLNRDDSRSHLDERIANIEHELALIKEKVMPSKDF